MKKEDIRPGMILQHKKTGRIGTPYTGYDYGCIDDSIEVAMIFQGNDKKPNTPSFLGTPFEELEPYKLKPEDMLTKKHIDEYCKPGKGKESCRYLCASSDGFECAKISGSTSVAWHMDERVRLGKANAQSINCGGRYGSLGSSREDVKKTLGV